MHFVWVNDDTVFAKALQNQVQVLLVLLRILAGDDKIINVDVAEIESS